MNFLVLQIRGLLVFVPINTTPIVLSATLSYINAFSSALAQQDQVTLSEAQAELSHDHPE